MTLFCTLLFRWTVILNLIESSLQSQPPAEPTVRARSRSPTLKQTFPTVLGFTFDQLEFLRLVPHSHPHRIFELKRYAFPPEKRITLRTRNNFPHALATGEQIALSTSNGDICAILDKTSCKHTILRAIFTPAFGMTQRVKININSGVVEKLTAEEIAECPVSLKNRKIANIYGVSRLSSPSTGRPNEDHDAVVDRFEPSSPSSARSPPPAGTPIHERFQSSPLRQTFSSVLRYRFEDLELIRLVPQNNPNQIFKLRIYAFPPDKLIGLRTKYYSLNPMPTGDQIVLAKSNGDVCAILQKSSNKCEILRPIFTARFGMFERVKINMDSGAVELLTRGEIDECPVTHKESITKIYRVFRVPTETPYQC